MLRHFLACLSAIALFSWGVAAAQSKEGRQLDELMHRSGLWIQVGQMQAQVRAGMQAQAQAARGQGGSPLSDEDYKQMLAAADFAFAPNRLRTALSSQLAVLLSIQDEKEVLKWLLSGLGKRFTVLEEKSGEITGDESARQKEAEKLAQSMPRERKEKLERLADSIQIGEGGASMMINITSAIIYGVALSTPLADAKSVVETMRGRMEQQRSQMAARIRKEAVEGFALTYKSMSDEELEQYVKFAESPAGKRYHDASVKALDHVLTQASFEMGQRIVLLKKEPGRSG